MDTAHIRICAICPPVRVSVNGAGADVGSAVCAFPVCTAVIM